MKNMLCIILLCSGLCTTYVNAQQMNHKRDTIYSNQIHEKMLHLLITSRLYMLVDDAASADIVYIKQGVIDGVYYFKKRGYTGGEGTRKRDYAANGALAKGKPLFQVHGNVMYNLDYRGLIDTPFQQRDVYQHTIQTYLEITYKDNYPLRIYFTNRFSNSVLFKNFSDINFQFSPQDFSRKIKEQIKSRIKPPVSPDELDAAKEKLKHRTTELAQLRNWIKDPGTIQKMIEARERLMLKKQQPAAPKPFTDTTTEFDVKDSIGEKTIGMSEIAIDSLLNDDFLAEFKSKEKKIDSLKNEVALLDKQYKDKKSVYDTYVAKAKSVIDNVQSVPELKEKLRELNISDTALPKGYKYLFSLKSFGLGRNIIDYSELSAKNISVTGISLEYNPSWYIAFASGAVDYRFRDYIIQRSSQPKQYLNIVRVGKGIRSRNNVILTVYQGKRQLYNISTIQGQAIPNYRLMGYTIEGTYRINKNIYFVGEVAKSSLPYYSPAADEEKLFSGAMKFDDRSNEAYSLKLFSYISSTNTRINGSVKHIGANFQSFSVFTSGSSQTNWNIRIDQFLFKKKLSIAAGLRTNEFSNPYIGSTYQSSTLFKSIQATLRMKKLPVISIGYYPSSQLTRLDQGRLVENQFYTLTGTLNHFYRYQKTLFNTAVVYTQFYNKAVDSGFTYFNSKNFLLSQSMFLNKITASMNLSALINTDYNIYTAGVGMDYKLNDRFSFGGGVKYNRQTVVASTKLGYSASLTLVVPRIGEFRLYTDKGFIPSANRQLVTNNTGQLTYFKTF